MRERRARSLESSAARRSGPRDPSLLRLDKLGRWHGIQAAPPNEASVIAASDVTWQSLGASDWLEAFQSHPRIGEPRVERAAPAQFSAWSAQEQRKVSTAGDAIKLALAQGNRDYEQKFGRIFIVCATGKSASEILE